MGSRNTHLVIVRVTGVMSDIFTIISLYSLVMSDILPIISVISLYSLVSTVSGIKVSPNCSQPLGMEDGRISNTQITASSSYQEDIVGPHKARLNSEEGGGAWCPDTIVSSNQEKQQYLEIDLLVDHVISSVVLQGRFANGVGQEYAEHYMLQFWRRGMDRFAEYRDEKAGLLLKGNTNTYETVEHVLVNMLVIASKVRIVPYSWHPRTVCLRVELKGCLYTGNFYNLFVHETEMRKGLLENSLAEKALQVDNWNEKTFLGAAVGILVTVVLAALAAVILVIVRNKRQRKSLSDISRYSNTSMDSIEQEYQSTMGSEGRFARLDHQDMAMERKKDWVDQYSETSKNYTTPSVLRFGLRSPCPQTVNESEEDDLSLTMFSIKEESHEDDESEATTEDTKKEENIVTRCSTPYNGSMFNTDGDQESVKSKKFVFGQLSFAAPAKSAVVRTNKKSRPALGMLGKQ